MAQGEPDIAGRDLGRWSTNDERIHGFASPTNSRPWNTSTPKPNGPYYMPQHPASYIAQAPQAPPQPHPFHRIADALERIAAAMERTAPKFRSQRD